MSKDNPNAPALRIGQLSHPGETGKNNEDRYGSIVVPVTDNRTGELLVAVVADGIGGQNAGEEASDLAVETIKAHLRQHASANGIEDALTQALLKTNDAIYRRSQESDSLRGMGTTATAAVISDDKLYVANVGDSRTYLIRGQSITQLTVDHTWAQEMIEAGRMTPEAAKRHPNRNVLKRYLGITQYVDVDRRIRPIGLPSDQDNAVLGGQPVSLEPGDVLLLCSDGLTDLVTDPELLAAVNKYPVQRAADQLVQMARSRGGHDNITVMILQYGAGSAKPAAVAIPVSRLGMVGGVVGVLAIIALIIVLLSGRAAPAASGTPAAQEVKAATPSKSISAVAAATPTPTPVADTARTAATPNAEANATPAAGEAEATPTPRPMATALPTKTAAPTNTEAPTTAARTTNGGGRNTPAASSGGATAAVTAPQPLEPPANETVKGRVTFRWQGVALPPGAAYEVVWWQPDTDANSAAQGMAKPTTETFQEIDLAGLALPADRQVNWAVLVVQQEPYKKLLQPADATSRVFVFKRIECREKCDTCETTDPVTGEIKKSPCNCRTVCD